jgi:hypothetical protein
MTGKQHARYWREWSRVRKILIELGEFSKEDDDEHRHEIHRQALGQDKSSKDFTNRDLDKIFEAFQAILVMEDGPRKGPVEDQACKRLIWAIDQLALPAPYLEKIAQDQFGTPAWRALPEEKLSKFRMTATARAAALKRQST